MRRLVTILVGLCVISGPKCGLAAGAGAPGKRAPQRLAGLVQDSLGRPVAGAEVSLQAASGRVIAKARSDAQGRFYFDKVVPGTYAVIVTKQSFKPAMKVAAVGAGKPTQLTLAMASEQLSLSVLAKRLDVARNSLSPQTGGSVYRFSQQALHDLPQGNNTPLNQVLLQAPGVAQDSFGQIHVRGEHADLQYRINGVQLPEGITGFGQVLSPRLAESINFLTGALPAEYGYRTAGVIDIHTKSGLTLDGGERGHVRRASTPPFYRALSWGIEGQTRLLFHRPVLQNQRGVEPPTPGPSAYHDKPTRARHSAICPTS